MELQRDRVGFWHVQCPKGPESEEVQQFAESQRPVAAPACIGPCAGFQGRRRGPAPTLPRRPADPQNIAHVAAPRDEPYTQVEDQRINPKSPCASHPEHHPRSECRYHQLPPDLPSPKVDIRHVHHQHRDPGRKDEETTRGPRGLNPRSHASAETSHHAPLAALRNRPE